MKLMGKALRIFRRRCGSIPHFNTLKYPSGLRRTASAWDSLRDSVLPILLFFTLCNHFLMKLFQPKVEHSEILVLYWPV